MFIGDISRIDSPDELPVGDHWRITLEEIPTVFGRLVYLTGLRSSLPDDGGAAPGDRPRSAASHAARVIGHAHLQAFSRWLTLGLSDQIRDLCAYTGDGNELPASDSLDLVPPSAREVEKQLFLTDMETLLGLLRVEGSASSAML